MTFRVYLGAYFQGYGRFTIDEFYEIGKKDIKAINDLIGSKKFLFDNEKPCEADGILVSNLKLIYFYFFIFLKQVYLECVQSLYTVT
jgi:hypothetical protein